MAKSEQTVVWLGNTAPLMADGSRASEELGNTATQIGMREGFDDLAEVELALSTNNDPMLAMIGRLLDKKDLKYAIGVLEVSQLLGAHNAAGAPAFVDSNDPDFERVLADFFRCPVGVPNDFQISELAAHALNAMTPPGDDPAGPRGLADQAKRILAPPMGGGAYETAYQPEEFSHEFGERWRQHELLTNAGRDALHAQHYGTAAQPAAFNYMAVSANTAAESAANTSLPGEITTAGGGLLRKQGTYAHTAGTNTTTLTATFTANGSDTLPVTIAKVGVLNAASTGTFGYEDLLNATAVLSVSGDNVAITYTFTIG